MRRAVLVGVTVWLLAAAPAHALTLGKPVAHGWLKRHPAVETARCPSGVPVQTITVVNQANARPSALARVERAVLDQSVQLRAAWGTPCVQFGPGGWLVYLKVGGDMPHGEHDSGTSPYALVWTGGGSWRSWSVAFSHEIVEMLVAPQSRGVFHNGVGVQLEVADPVDNLGYHLDGVYVTDFVLQSWYDGASQDAMCVEATCMFSTPISSDTGPPYDEMGSVTAPWTSRQ